jgi:hypothetical protein
VPVIRIQYPNRPSNDIVFQDEVNGYGNYPGYYLDVPEVAAYLQSHPDYAAKFGLTQTPVAETVPVVAPESSGIAEKISYGIQSVQDFITTNPLAAGATVLGLAGATAATVAAVAVARKSTSRRKPHRSSSGRGRKASHRRRSGSGRAKSRGPRKTRNRRGGAVKDRYKGRKVYRTKRGQPYILMANGKARFVKA